jgi:hypothetical protein
MPTVNRLVPREGSDRSSRGGVDDCEDAAAGDHAVFTHGVVEGQ